MGGHEEDSRTAGGQTRPSKGKSDSKQVAAAALQLAVTADREAEACLVDQLRAVDIAGAATDFGGDYLKSISLVLERSVVAARREGVIGHTHSEEGAVTGAAHEAIMQISNKATGLNVGGKIGIARHDDHVCVAIFFAVGLLHLDEVAVGLGHRVV